MKKTYTKNIQVLIIILTILFQNCGDKSKTDHKKPIAKGQIRNDSLKITFDPKSASDKAYKIDSLFMHLYSKGIFNGNVLVSQNGRIIYKGAFGYADFGKKRPLSLNTAFQLASVSKQFTSVAIMQLKQKGLLNYSDPVYKHVPNFPYDSSITIRSLLTHSSGIPNYIYALDKIYDKKNPLSNSLVVNLMGQYRPNINYLPNKKFNYNNSNYMYLAYIVEKLSGMNFRQYAQKNLFGPAGMSHTFIFDPNKSSQIAKAANGYLANKRIVPPDYLDGVVGDKGVYSTVEDLFKWDTALNTEKLLKAETLNEAFQPKLDFKNLINKNYGYGWRLQLLDDGTWLTFHTGWWHGFKNFYLHNNQDNSSIIILSNLANSYLTNAKKVEAILYPEKAKHFIGEEEEAAEMGGTSK
ncbi:MAG: serine hydrolase domain-containing protein [Bacteroidota bacterium]